MWLCNGLLIRGLVGGLRFRRSLWVRLRLNVGRLTSLGFEDWIVAQAVAFAFLAVSACGMGFVALYPPLSTSETARLGSPLDLFLMSGSGQLLMHREGHAIAHL